MMDEIITELINPSYQTWDKVNPKTLYHDYFPFDAPNEVFNYYTICFSVLIYVKRVRNMRV